MKYSLKQACDAVGGRLVGSEVHVPITQWAYDSRLPFSAEATCFLALDGPTRSGASYIPDLIKRGVKMFCVNDQFDTSFFPTASFWAVPNVLSALQALAKHRRKQFNGEVVGITGSNGKTIVKEWLYGLLGGEKRGIYRSPVSFNSQLGVALSVLGIPEVVAGTTLPITTAIIEAGISRAGEMGSLREMIRPTLGLLTNLGDAHDGGFDSRDEKLLEKMSLFTLEEQGNPVTNSLILASEDYDRFLLASSGHSRLSSKLILWSERAKNSSNTIVSFEKGLEIFLSETSSSKQKLSLPLPYTTAASRQNLANACLAAIQLGIQEDELRERIGLLPQSAMRLAVSVGHDGSRIIDDSYSNDLQGLDAALDFFSQQRMASGYSIAVLGKLGDSISSAQQPLKGLAEKLERSGVQRLVLVGDAFEGIETYLSKGIVPIRIEQSVEVSSYLLSLDLTDATILIKGARSQELDKIAKRLQRKTHEVRLEIDLAALTQNIAAYRSRLKSQTRICVMVKAEAYGSGSREIARFFEERGVDYLAVAYVDEGIALRKAGSTLPIIVGNSSRDQVGLIEEYALEPEITTLQQLKNFRDTDTKLHIKLDTGMHRLGFDATGGAETELPGLVAELSTQAYKVASVFSHLSASDKPDADGFSRKQNEYLEAGYSKIWETLGYRPLLHLLNSAGAWRMPEFQHDMVRLGLGIYGLGLEDVAPGVLEPAHQLIAKVIQLREVGAGEVVGYNLGGVANHSRKIGVVNIGYADGLRRHAGNGRYAFGIWGKQAFTVGSICMDFCMIDVSELENIEVGDDVEIFGKTQSLRGLASCCDTISYEVLTGIGPRVRRVYFG